VDIMTIRDVAAIVLVIGALDLASPEPPALRFVLGPQTRWLSAQQLLVHYELTNVSGLLGQTIANVPPECRRNLRMTGVFQMEDGDDWGLTVAGRRIEAEPLPVAIEDRPRDGAARASHPD
jgi:hypothetical protein